MVGFLSTEQNLGSIISAPGQNIVECMELYTAGTLTSAFVTALGNIRHSDGCKICLNAALQNKQLLKLKKKIKFKKNTSLKTEIDSYSGLPFQAPCWYAQRTLWKDRNQQQAIQWTIPFTIYVFPFFFNFCHICTVHLHSKAPLFPDGILPASLWLPSGRIALHLLLKLQPALLQLSVSNMKQRDSLST